MVYVEQCGSRDLTHQERYFVLSVAIAGRLERAWHSPSSRYSVIRPIQPLRRNGDFSSKWIARRAGLHHTLKPTPHPSTPDDHANHAARHGDHARRGWQCRRGKLGLPTAVVSVLTSLRSEDFASSKAATGSSRHESRMYNNSLAAPGPEPSKRVCLAKKRIKRLT
jgi:hypothetical protein